MGRSKIAKSLIALIALGGAQAARAAETSPFGALLPPEATYRELSPYEFRFGGFAHDPASPEKGSADLSGDLLFGHLSLTDNPWWRFLTIRGHVGGTYNTAHKTDGEYLGLAATAALYDKFFVEGTLDGAFNDGMTGGVKPLNRSAMGCHVGFHESGSVGYQFTEHWSLMATVEHYSNLNFCLLNHGMTNYGARIGYAF